MVEEGREAGEGKKGVFSIQGGRKIDSLSALTGKKQEVRVGESRYKRI